MQPSTLKNLDSTMPDVSHFIHDKAEQKKRIEEKRQMILEFLAAETFSTSEIISSLLNVS